MRRPSLEGAWRVKRVRTHDVKGCRTQAGPGRAAGRGIALLEVVLALALFVGMAMAVISGMTVCIRSAGLLREEAQAADFAVTVLSEIELGVTPAADAPATAFEKPYEEWTWQTTLTPGAPTVPEGIELSQVEIIVRHVPTGYTYRLYNLAPPAAPADATAVVQTAMAPGGRP
jgi:type II secretion system protein I